MKKNAHFIEASAIIGCDSSGTMAASKVMKYTVFEPLLIAGSGASAYVDSLKARVAAAGIADHIVWLGYVGGAQKSAALAAVDVFAVPSFSENFGAAAAEAMLAGLPGVLGEGVTIAPNIAHAGAGLAARLRGGRHRQRCHRTIQSRGYESGEVAKDDAEAMKWYRKAAALVGPACATRRTVAVHAGRLVGASLAQLGPSAIHGTLP